MISFLPVIHRLPARKVMVAKTGGENESDCLRAVDSNDSEMRATV